MKTYHTPEEVAADLPEEIGEKYLANFDPNFKANLFPCTLYYAVCNAFPLCGSDVSYWQEVANRARAGEFDPKGEETTVMPSLDQIFDSMMDEMPFKLSSNIHPYIKELAIRYAAAVSAHERQRAERAEKEVERLKETLKEVEVFLSKGPWPSTKMLEKIRAVLGVPTKGEETTEKHCEMEQCVADFYGIELAKTKEGSIIGDGSFGSYVDVINHWLQRQSALAQEGGGDER